MRILIVNDDDTSLYLLEQALLREFPEAEVALCHGGTQALEALDRQRADAIITDNRMPAMTGIEMVRAIRQRDVTTPIMMLTGAEDKRSDALAAGVTVFFSGVNWPDIRREIRQMLEAHPRA